MLDEAVVLDASERGGHLLIAPVGEFPEIIVIILLAGDVDLVADILLDFAHPSEQRFPLLLSYALPHVTPEQITEREICVMQFVQLIVQPDFVIPVMHVVPGSESSRLDVGNELLHIRSLHQLSSEILPFTHTPVLEHSGYGNEIRSRMCLQIVHYVAHAIVEQHLAVGPVGVIYLEYPDIAASLLHILAEDVEGVHAGAFPFEQFAALGTKFLVVHGREVHTLPAVPGLSRPYLKELASEYHLLHRVRGIGVELYMLKPVLAVVTLAVLPGIPGERIHVVHPPESRHNLQLIVAQVVVHQREWQRDMHLRRIVGLAQERIGRKPAGMLQAGAETRPESPARTDFIVIRAAVVVAAYGRARSYVRLSHQHCRHQERIVVVLLVRREDQVVQDLTAGNRAVVSKEGMDKPGAVLEVRVVAHHETDTDDIVENMATVADYTVHQHHALAYLRRLLLRGVYGHVLELAGALDIAVVTYFRILDDGAVLDDRVVPDRTVIAPAAVISLLGECRQPLLKLWILDESGLQIRIRRNHSVKRINLPRAGLVHHVYAYADILILSVL